MPGISRYFRADILKTISVLDEILDLGKRDLLQIPAQFNGMACAEAVIRLQRMLVSHRIQASLYKIWV